MVEEIKNKIDPIKVSRRSINKVYRWYLNKRLKRIHRFKEEPHLTQKRVLEQLIQAGNDTEFGERYDFSSVRTPREFAKAVPVSDYETLKPFITRMMHGEKDVLWRGQINWFSKSSGTTADKSKFIPVTNENLQQCHIRGTWDTMTLMYKNNPEARQFECKTLVMGGSLESYEPYPKTTFGDVSAIMIKHLPWIARPFFTPDIETALLSDWEVKIERMARLLCEEEDMVMIGGVPTWTIVLFRRILELTGKNNILEVWPDFQAYIHGGVSFLPYQDQFREFFPSDDIIYQEIYNASEGYFAVQDNWDSKDMLLLLDNGVYYEFLPVEEWDKETPEAIPLKDVEVGKKYALVISTNAGLWRYTIGDTITFTSTNPYKIKITGRTQQFINAFGEEVMVANTDKALSQTCTTTDALVTDYSVAPIYLSKTGKGGHEWIIEFEKPPENIEEFRTLLDKNLQQINSDYEAKRFKNMALEKLHLHIVPQGTFHRWLRWKGKLGGQNKVPRLSNSRKYIEEILQFIQ